jgi:hypothetical protein
MMGVVMLVTETAVVCRHCEIDLVDKRYNVFAPKMWIGLILLPLVAVYEG